MSEITDYILKKHEGIQKAINTINEKYNLDLQLSEDIRNKGNTFMMSIDFKGKRNSFLGTVPDNAEYDFDKEYAQAIMDLTDKFVVGKSTECLCGNHIPSVHTGHDN